MRELPKRWVEATLDECTLLNPKLDHRAAFDEQVSFVPMPAVSDLSGTIENPQDRAFGEVSKGYTRFQTGDVIFAKITPCMENGKIAVARGLTNNIGVGSTEFHVVRPLGGILSDYVWRFLRQKSFRSDAERAMTGAVGQRRVPLDYLRESVLPLPPLAEQRRIVAKIDSLSAKSKRARDHLGHIPRLVEKYKQAILAAAYSDAERLSTEDTTLGDVSLEVRNGLSKKPSDEPLAGAPILRISAVRPLSVRLQDVRYYPEVVPDNALIRDGDLLFTRYNGNANFVAVCGMVRGLTRDATYPDKLIRVRLSDVIDPKFAELICAAPKSREWLAPYIKTAAGQHGISGSDLKRLPIPLPPLANQRVIASRTATAFDWIDRLATEANSARKLTDHLDQAILAKAFRGELVSQDPTDEPASILLERIKAERETAKTPPRKAKQQN